MAHEYDEYGGLAATESREFKAEGRYKVHYSYITGVEEKLTWVLPEDEDYEGIEVNQSLNTTASGERKGWHDKMNASERISVLTASAD